MPAWGPGCPGGKTRYQWLEADRRRLRGGYHGAWVTQVAWRAPSSRRTMLLWVVKLSLGGEFGRFLMSAVVGQDREGPLLAEGRLL
jgi:hypothetical protein